MESHGKVMEFYYQIVVGTLRTSLLSFRHHFQDSHFLRHHPIA